MLLIIIYPVRPKTNPGRFAVNRALWALAADPKAPAFLGRQLAAVPAAQEKRLADLIADLDSDRYPVREAASRELKALGEQVQSATESKSAATAERYPTIDFEGDYGAIGVKTWIYRGMYGEEVQDTDVRPGGGPRRGRR